ncbi:MAG: hypothetical protein OXI43_03305 [Candidatus Poribacteria bacterium]|nr:hypothetical protein [Candidatus Poribacteria bacterium]
MKRHKPFLKEDHSALLNSSLYSILCACVVLFVFALLAINCGPIPPGEHYTPEATTTAAENTTTIKSTQSTANLPETATVDLKKQPYVTNAFKQLPRTRSRGNLHDLQLKLRERVQHSAIVTNCSFDVLKAFVAKGWAPVVLIQLQGRTPVILSVTHYDNRSNVVHLHNPVNLNKRQLTYEEFKTSWAKNTRNQCFLITPQQLTKKDIQNVLGEYLSTESFQEISVRSR